MLDDFQHCIYDAREPLRDAGIAFFDVAGSFRIRIGKVERTFPVGKDERGWYYFVASGRNPHVERGVIGPVMEAARLWFGLK